MMPSSGLSGVVATMLLPQERLSPGGRRTRGLVAPSAAASSVATTSSSPSASSTVVSSQSSESSTSASPSLFLSSLMPLSSSKTPTSASGMGKAQMTGASAFSSSAGGRSKAVTPLGGIISSDSVSAVEPRSFSSSVSFATPERSPLVGMEAPSDSMKHKDSPIRVLNGGVVCATAGEGGECGRDSSSAVTPSVKCGSSPAAPRRFFASEGRSIHSGMGGRDKTKSSSPARVAEVAANPNSLPSELARSGAARPPLGGVDAALSSPRAMQLRKASSRGTSPAQVSAKGIALQPRKSPSTARAAVTSASASSPGSKPTLMTRRLVTKEEETMMESSRGEEGARSPDPTISQFFAAKISPLLRSSSRVRKKREFSSPRPAAGAVGFMVSLASAAQQEHTKTPTATTAACATSSSYHPGQDLPDIADANLLSPCGIFLSPRTPKLIVDQNRGGVGGASAGGGGGEKTPKAGEAPLTPSNFASDFGRGHRLSASFDASNVFSWLHSPTGQGLFSPSGGLTAASVTNTPRGMYGFFKDGGLGGGAGSKTPGTPRDLAAAAVGSSSSLFFSDVEELPGGAAEGGVGADLASSQTATARPRGGGGGCSDGTEAVVSDPQSIICISPLASQRGVGSTRGAGGTHSAPETPINFMEVFASPARLPTPRLRCNGAQKNGGTGNPGGALSHPSPVVSALHTAERDLMEDEDLNVLLQLAGTTTPGGRPLSFKAGILSPLLTSSVRKLSSKMQHDAKDAPANLQLPIIIGSSTNGSTKKLTRKGSSSQDDFINTPQLSIRTSSSVDSPSKRSKSKKRKMGEDGGVSQQAADAAAMSAHAQHHQHQHQHNLAYPHPNMLHYRHYPAHHQPMRHGTGVYYAHQAVSYQQAQHQSQRTTAPLPPRKKGKAKDKAAAHHESSAATAGDASHAHPGYNAYHPRAGAPHHHGHPPQHHHMAYPPQRHPQHQYSHANRDASAATVGDTAPPLPQSSSSKSSSKRSKNSSKKKNGETLLGSGSKKKKSTSSKKKISSSPKPKITPLPTVLNPVDRERVAAAIRAATGVDGEKTAALLSAILRGVTMRPSGKWQAQLYYAGKSRYIGVFDSREKAALAYEIAREVLKTEKGSEPVTPEMTERNVNVARKAAFAGVNEQDPRFAVK